MTFDTPERPWSLEEVRVLNELVREQVSVRLIALKTKRSEMEIHAKLSQLGLTTPAAD